MWAVLWFPIEYLFGGWDQNLPTLFLCFAFPGLEANLVSQRKKLWYEDSEGAAQHSPFASVRTELETPGFPRVH